MNRWTDELCARELQVDNILETVGLGIWNECGWYATLCTLSACHVEKEMLMWRHLCIRQLSEVEDSTIIFLFKCRPCRAISLESCHIFALLMWASAFGGGSTVGLMFAICGSDTLVRPPDIQPKCRCQIQTDLGKFWETDIVKSGQNREKSLKWHCHYPDGFYNNKKGHCH
jgi:hypothetical protein